MKLNDVVTKLKLQQVTSFAKLDMVVQGGYVSDLLSNVMGQAKPGMIWVTMQGHHNIAAVGSLIGLAAIIVAGDAKVEQDAIEKGNDNDLPIFVTALSSYDIVGALNKLGVTNEQEKK